jgi:hypothetical protein
VSKYVCQQITLAVIDLDLGLNRFESFSKLSLVLLRRFVDLCQGRPKRLLVDEDIASPTYVAPLRFADYRFDSFNGVMATEAVPLCCCYTR